MNFNVLLQDHKETWSRIHYIKHILTWGVKKMVFRNFSWVKTTCFFLILSYKFLDEIFLLCLSVDTRQTSSTQNFIPNVCVFENVESSENKVYNEKCQTTFIISNAGCTACMEKYIKVLKCVSTHPFQLLALFGNESCQ